MLASDPGPHSCADDDADIRDLAVFKRGTGAPLAGAGPKP
jgi:hypothetical protein